MSVSLLLRARARSAHDMRAPRANSMTADDRGLRPRCDPRGGLVSFPITMAILERSGTRIRCHLLTRHLVGRSSLAHLRLADPGISAEHAILCWTGREWEVHDLGSRNGTTVDGRRLAQGERAPLARGAAIGF